MRLSSNGTLSKLFFKLIILFLILIVHYSCNSFFGGGRNKKSPKSTFKLLDKEIEKGGFARLSWYVEEADSIRLEGLIERANPIDTLRVRPDTMTTYTMYIHRGVEVKRRTQKVKVYVPIASSIEAPDSVGDEDEIELKWRTRNSLYASIDGLYDSLKRSGQMIIKRDTTTRFILRAHGRYNTDTISKVTEVTLVEEIEAPPKIFKGQVVPISWKLKRTDSVKVDGFDGTFKAVDKIMVKPLDTKSYSIIAYKEYGRPKYYDRIIFVMPPRINFGGSGTIIKGEQGNVFWQVLGGDSVFIGKEMRKVNLRGALKISPKADTTLYLTVFSEGKKLERDFTMFVMNDRRYIEKVKPVSSLETGERIDLDVLNWEYESFNNNLLINFCMVDTTGSYITKAFPKGAYKNIISKLTLESESGKENPSIKIEEPDPDGLLKNNITVLGDLSLTSLEEGRILHHAVRHLCKVKSEKDELSFAIFNGTKQNLYYDNLDTTLVDSVFQTDDLSLAVGRNYFESIQSYLKRGFRETGKEVLILFVSGKDNNSFFPCNSVDVDGLLQDLVQNKVKVFVVNYGENADRDILKAIVNSTGGKFYQVYRDYDVVLAFKEIGLGLQYFYQLSLYPEYAENTTLNLEYKNRTGGKTRLHQQILLNQPSISQMIFDTTMYWNLRDKHVQSPPQTLVYFESNSSEVSDMFIEKIQEVVECLKENPGRKIMLLGHSDLTGSEELCNKIAEERVINTKQFFLEAGITNERVLIDSFGKDFPDWQNEENDIKARENRRVDVVWIEE